MPPGTRRANRGGYVEHDDFEGLPVRQWRQEWTSIAAPAQPELQHQNDVWAVELLHGMPKDAALLPPHTQELLRAARSGRLYKRPVPEEEEADGDTAPPDKMDKKEEEDLMSQGYQLRLWKQIPKNVEAPVISHLAKRRKNVVTIASRTVEEKVQGPTVTRATVRRIDAAGNPYTEEVTLAEGQQLDGEIISTRVEALPVAKAETLTPAAPVPRRRPPPPKRKAKAGPGRGKKKMRGFPGASAHNVGALPSGTSAATIVKSENDNGMNLSQIGTRTPAQESEIADGDDDDDEDDDVDVDVDDGDGDEGDEGDEGEGEGDETVETEQCTADATATMIKSRDSESIDPVSAAEPPDSATLDVEMNDDGSSAVTNDGTSTFFAPPAPAHPATHASYAGTVVTAPLGGSPLKNMVMQSPMEAPEPLPLPGPLENATDTAHTAAIHTADTAPPPPPPPPPSESFAQEPRASEAVDKAALLPPPPEQVGNISSPGTYKSSEDGNKSQVSRAPEESDAKSSALAHQNPAIIEDMIKPEDSVSVTAPLPGSAATSEVGTVSLDETKDAPLRIVAETLLEPAPEPSSEGQDEPPAPDEKEGPSHAEEEYDLLGGLMGELDRQDGEAQVLPDAADAVVAALQEVESEPPAPDNLAGGALAQAEGGDQPANT